MKRTTAEKEACKIAGAWCSESRAPIDPFAWNTLMVAIAGAIEKSARSERRACAKVADGVAYDAAENSAVHADGEVAAVRCGRLIRARGRK